jgi:hypothetical protein
LSIPAKGFFLTLKAQQPEVRELFHLGKRGGEAADVVERDHRRPSSFSIPP